VSKTIIKRVCTSEEFRGILRQIEKKTKDPQPKLFIYYVEVRITTENSVGR